MSKTKSPGSKKNIEKLQDKKVDGKKVKGGISVSLSQNGPSGNSNFSQSGGA